MINSIGRWLLMREILSQKHGRGNVWLKIFGWYVAVATWLSQLAQEALAERVLDDEQHK